MEFLKIMRVDDAQQRFLRACPSGPLEVERVDLGAALGRVAGEDVTARADLPGFARATVDGFAVIASDTFGASEGLPAYLRVTGEVFMGQTATTHVHPGECMRIATGGMLPPGADAVVMVEHTDMLADDEVGLMRPASPGQNVIRAADDCAAGSVLVPAGQVLRPQELGLLAHAGVLAVPVARRPRCALLSTGDELVSPEQAPAPGQIRESNSYTLAPLIAECGAVPVYLGCARDDAAQIDALLRRAAAEADVIMVTGGSSVGTRDLAAALLDRLGKPGILVHGVSLKPGKPTILGLADGKPFLGLPGNPVSAQVVFNLFARPLLRQLAGLAAFPDFVPAVRARMSKNVASAPGRVDVIRVILVRREGELWAEPAQGKSGLISSLTRAHGTITIREGTEGLLAGEWVDIELI